MASLETIQTFTDLLLESQATVAAAFDAYTSAPISEISTAKQAWIDAQLKLATDVSIALPIIHGALQRAQEAA